MGMPTLFEQLELLDQVHAVKVTDRRRIWLSGAKPGDRWAVTLAEGGTFSYGRSFGDAFERALRVEVTPKSFSSTELPVFSGENVI